MTQSLRKTHNQARNSRKPIVIRLVTMLLSSFKRRTSRLMKSNLSKRLTTQMMI